MKDPLLTLSGYLLQRAAASALTELNQRLAPLGLRHAGVAMLMLIEARPGMTQSQAGRILDIQRANMVPFVARLEGLGVIRRRQVDGRSQALELTSRGRILLERARRIVIAHEAELLERVPEELRPMVLPVLLALWQGGTTPAAVRSDAGK
ncbi:MAG: MarR family transcriptional regulator [Gammaproteobacteria bacterium]|nr:MarR family transcriptional regulator [Gammaproteobacteria bacterium]